MRVWDYGFSLFALIRQKQRHLLLHVPDSYQSRDDYTDTQGRCWFSWSSYSALSPADTKSSDSQRALWLCSAMIVEVTRHETQCDNYITEIFTYVAMVLIYSMPVCVPKCPLLLCRAQCCSSTWRRGDRSAGCWGWDPAAGWFLQTTFSGPWDKALHWFLREKAHYGLSLISAVLGQFKPHMDDSFQRHHRGDDGWRSVNGFIDCRRRHQDVCRSYNHTVMFLQVSS